MNFSKLIEDDTHAPSSMRFAFLFVTLLTSTVVIGVWAFLCIKNGAFVSVPADVLKLIGVLLGSMTSGKVIQSFSENFSAKPTNPPTP